MTGSTGTTAVLTRPERSAPAGIDRPMPFVVVPSGTPAGPVGARTVGARTAAGARAMQRRRARLAADRRPPSGVLPSGLRRSAVVSADHADEVADRIRPVGRWVRLACTLCFTATAVLVAVVLLSSGGTQVVGPVVVQPGDTLWSVAQRADPGADPRSVVAQIKKLNGLSGDTVVAGVVLQVPNSTP